MKKNRVNMIVWWLIWLTYLEMIYRFFIVGDFLTVNTLSVVLFTVPWAILFGVITSLFNSKINRVINILLTFLVTIFTVAQIIYFKFYNSIFSFFSLTTGTGQVMQFWQRILEVILDNWYILLLIIIPIILVIIFRKKLFNYKRENYRRMIIDLIIMNIFIIGIVLRVNFDKGVYSLDVLFNKTHAPMLTINKTGLLTMERLDLHRYIFGFEEQMGDSEDENETEETEVVLEPEVEYNVLDIDFDKLISKTTNSTIKKMHKYFKSVEPTKKNEYTGLFKGMNIIMITGEAFDTIALDEDLTPTLYMMANNGFVFKNYYQPLYPISTSDGEYQNLTSLVPKEGVWSFYQSSKIKMSLTYGNMFKKNGYTTYGFHNHNYRYYDRHLSHPNAGFKYIGCGNGLEKKMNCSHWPNSDYEMIKGTTDYYFKKEPFATYYLTVSGHLNYNFGGNNMAYRNRKAVANLPYSDAVKAYMATHIELEKAMKELLSRLEASGQLDKTLIVIAPDHYPYGLTDKQLNERSKTDRSNKFEKFHTTLIMYNPTIERKEIDKVVSSLDIMPTLYNLFGLEYDSRLVMGRDIFSDQEHIVILSDRSWITDKGTYNSVTGKFKPFNKNEKVDKDYIKNINSIVKKRYSMSSLILDNNYYKKVGL